MLIGAREHEFRGVKPGRLGRVDIDHGEETILEIEAFVEIGFTPLEAIRAATALAAANLRLDGITGQLSPGLAADVLVVARCVRADHAAHSGAVGKKNSGPIEPEAPPNRVNDLPRHVRDSLRKAGSAAERAGLKRNVASTIMDGVSPERPASSPSAL